MVKNFLFILIIISFLLFLVINIPTPLKIEGDGVFYYSWLRSVAFDSDFDFYNELKHFSSYDVGSKWFLDTELKTFIGKIPNPYAYGTAILWTPFFLVAHIISLLLGLSTEGYSALYIFSVNFSSWVFGILSLIIIYLNLKKFFENNISFWSAVGIYLATPFVYYQLFEPSMSHMASLLMVCLFFNFVIKIYQKQKVNWLIFAIVVFLMVSIRWQNILFCVIFLPVLWQSLSSLKASARQSRNSFKMLLKEIIAISIPVIIFWISQALLWKHLYGHYFLQPQGKRFVRLDFHGLYILFSSNRGLLLWSPIIILAFLGFYYLWRKSKFLFIVAISAFLVQWLINGSLNDLGGGDAFGSRRFVEVLPFFALALSAFYQRFKFKKIFAISVIILIIWNIILVENYRHGFIPHHGEFNIYQINYLEVINRDIDKYLINKFLKKH